MVITEDNYRDILLEAMQGTTPTALSKKSGITRQTIYGIKDAGQSPNMFTFIRLIGGLGYDVEIVKK